MTKTSEQGGATAEHEALRLIASALSRIRFGAIQLTVHDGKVTQLDVTERRRLGS